MNIDETGGGNVQGFETFNGSGYGRDSGDRPGDRKPRNTKARKVLSLRVKGLRFLRMRDRACSATVPTLRHTLTKYPETVIYGIRSSLTALFEERQHKVAQETLKLVTIKSPTTKTAGYSCTGEGVGPEANT